LGGGVNNTEEKKSKCLPIMGTQQLNPSTSGEVSGRGRGGRERGSRFFEIKRVLKKLSMLGKRFWTYIGEKKIFE